jgi:SNF2 family DNA or RNA helicase
MIALTLALRLRECCAGFLKTETAERRYDSKCESLRDLLEELGEEQVLIFCNFTMEITVVCEMLAENGITFGRLDGAVKDVDRERNKEIFQGNKIRVLVCNTETGGYGLNFFNCSRVVFNSNQWSSKTRTQAIDRVYRIGQVRKCFIYDLVSVKPIQDVDATTIEDKLLRVCAKKEDIRAVLLGEKRK